MSFKVKSIRAGLAFLSSVIIFSGNFKQFMITYPQSPIEILKVKLLEIKVVEIKGLCLCLKKIVGYFSSI